MDNIHKIIKMICRYLLEVKNSAFAFHTAPPEILDRGKSEQGLVVNSIHRRNRHYSGSFASLCFRQKTSRISTNLDIKLLSGSRSNMREKRGHVGFELMIFDESLLVLIFYKPTMKLRP